MPLLALTKLTMSIHIKTVFTLKKTFYSEITKPSLACNMPLVLNCARVQQILGKIIEDET